ncbi:hypothetical protein C2S52_023266 [Perilla frutescens var. hirtella]|nr:hypothetical protein C2S52_023266 [Perilla frutescens var. hirtella]
MAQQGRSRKKKAAGEGALVSFRCHLWWLDQVKELLGPANMQHLKKSCFGHLFDIANLQFQGQLYHILVRNHLIPSIENRLSFNLNGRVHEFGPVEFGLMTGLKFSDWYEPPKASSIHSLLFTNRKCLKFIDISAAFRQKSLQMKYLHLADDLEQFEKYPWGRVSYEYLLKSTLSRRRVIDNIIRQQKSMAYDVYGILRWRVDEFYHYEQLMGYFAPEYAQRLERHMSPPKLFVAPPLKRKAGEGDVAGAAVNKRRLEPTLMKDRLRSGRLKDNAVHVDSTAESKSLPPNEKGEDSHVEEIISNEIDGQVKAIVRKLVVIESLLRRCKCCWKLFAEAGAVNEEGGDGLEPDEGLPNEVPEDEEKENVEVGEAVEEKSEDDGLSIEKKDLVDDLMKPAAVSPKTDKGLGFGVSSPPPRVYTRSSKRLSQTPLKSTCQRQLIDEEEPDEQTSSKHKLRKNAGPSSTKSVARQLFSPTNAMYDPLEATYHHKLTQPFQEWYDTVVKIQPEPETPFPIISKPRVPVSWFHDLLERTGWLCDEHIDALTNLLLFKYKRANESFLSGWAVLDVLSTGFLLKGDYSNTWESMMHYVNGVWPREYGLPWVEARQVLGVANVNKNHWVCYAICFESQTMTIYDSARGNTSWGSIAGHFLHMSRYMPWLYSHAGIWEQKKMGCELRDVWEIISAPDAPQQGNNHDCGIMAIKYMECLALNQDISSVDPERCGIWRRSYCAQLFELGREFPA